MVDKKVDIASHDRLPGSLQGVEYRQYRILFPSAAWRDICYHFGVEKLLCRKAVSRMYLSDKLFCSRRKHQFIVYIR